MLLKITFTIIYSGQVKHTKIGENSFGNHDIKFTSKIFRLKRKNYKIKY